ncbi:hypothetical protein, partial [Mesorhizobium sp. M00.F.Ca.ET.220.01.1.1]|uniref:hypothetical protein n=1 Tax=Mesorhizobium sp. M00.F.Ca.ET.220.01.1.1 TaxID=2500531 RepID=UPI001AED17D6
VLFRSQHLTGEKVVGGFFDGFLAVRYHRRNTVVGGNDKAPGVPAIASRSNFACEILIKVRIRAD